MTSMAFSTPIALAMALYLAVVRLLRHQRARVKQAEYVAKHDNTKDLSSMTFLEAQAIILTLSDYEFPFTFLMSLKFALFRTYGIPSISSLLLSTTLFTSPSTASKRYTDTSVLVADFMVADWGSKRWLESISRINCIHEPYIHAGKISNDDLLLTISLFAREPVRWIHNFEWRRLDDLERCALGVFWKGVGDAMEIKYEALPSAANKGWRDGLHWLDEVTSWADDYEKQYMVPETANHKVAEEMTAILLWNMPGFLKLVAKQAVAALMDDRLRVAMVYEKPYSATLYAVHGVLQIRRYILQYLCLPRPDRYPSHAVTREPTEQGTYFTNVWDSLPYYVRPTIWNRWLSAGAWIARLQGLPLPGDDGMKYCPQGYSAPNCGPNHGKTRQKEMEEKVGAVGRMTCPFGSSRTD